jgi:hypothetical protein
MKYLLAIGYAKYFLFVLLIQILSFNSTGQNANISINTALARLDSLEKIANHYSDNHPVEKLYVHFDKPFYMLGEVSWYKVYVVNGSDLNPTDISSVINLDWINPSGKIISHQRLKIENGGAAGDFTLDTALREGIYTLRAYTNWMRNETPELFFSKKMKVYNPQTTKPVLQANNTVSKTDIQFFPEGGTLVEGINTKIAFKAIDVHGKGIEVNGKIIDEQNNTITDFRSVHNGMGTFPFTPRPHKIYRAVLENGEIYPLPVAVEKGIVLTASNTNANKILIRVQAVKEYNSSPVYLIGHSRGSICYAGYIKTDSTLKDISISKDSLPEGVLQLTLLNSKGMPQCERMLFIKKKHEMVVSVSSNKEKYSPRDLIALDFKLNDAKGNAVPGSLSVSVTDAGFVTAKNYFENIYTRLLLQSDIKGNIESPTWYFETQTLERIHALDLVMLTQGWSRYNWEKILSKEPDSIFYLPENGIALEGKIFSNNKPVTNATFMLTNPRSGNDSVSVYETDSLGNFFIPDLYFSDSSLISFRVMNKKGIIENVKIELANMQDFPPVFSYGIQDAEENKNEFAENLKGWRVWNPDKYKMLEEVIVKSQANKIKTVGFGAKLVKPDAADLKARVATSQFVSRYAMKVPFYDAARWRAVRVFIDGIEVDTSGFAGNPYIMLNSVPIEDIEHVIIDGKPHTGYIIAIMTKKSGSQKIAGSVRKMVKGYDAAREFYHPRYGPSDTSTTGLDNRITLYWNANLQIGKAGIATAKFYNADTTKNLLVVAEGIVNGIPVSCIKVVGQKESVE